MINKNWPYYSNEEIKKVVNVLKSGKVNYWTGKHCNKFEKLYAKKFNLNYCITVANGTVALEAVLKSLNLNIDDEVLVPSKSYQSSASAIVNSGAKPIFCDIDFNSQNLLINDLIKKISNKTKAIICVHLGGWPCEMNKIIKIARKKKIVLIEDCSQAHGAKINKKFVGSFGDMAIWSFCNDKIISTGGEGAMISVKKKRYWKKIWAYKDIGKNYDKVKKNLKNTSSGFNWVHDTFGTNLRMTEMQAVLGIHQLKKLNQTISKRIHLNNLIWKSLKNYKSVIIPNVPKNINLSPYRCYVKLNLGMIKKRYDLKKIIKLLNSKEQICNEGSCSEMYLENSFKILNLSPKKRLKNASKLSAISLAFYINPLISGIDMNKRIKKITKVFDQISA
ncbi:DegT/DnrJ/EryC1/StrS aminotransferase family protein [Candidatus Pelagibacter sp.]|nr:DegT/DnrJ/EryC1/StrS aminotransferase family protein [Candidatus Pelagibacter sp.]